MNIFLLGLTTTLTEYNELFVRRLAGKVTVDSAVGDYVTETNESLKKNFKSLNRKLFKNTTS